MISVRLIMCGQPGAQGEALFIAGSTEMPPPSSSKRWRMAVRPKPDSRWATIWPSSRAAISMPPRSRRRVIHRDYQSVRVLQRVRGDFLNAAQDGIGARGIGEAQFFGNGKMQLHARDSFGEQL